MAKVVFVLEVVREFESKEAAVKAAERQERMGNRRVTISRERRTDSGQPFERSTIWKDLAQVRDEKARRDHELRIGRSRHYD